VLLLLISAAVADDDIGALNQQPGVDAERPADQAEHDHAADTEPAGADWQTTHSAATAKAATITAAILDVAAFRHVIQAHSDSPVARPGNCCRVLSISPITDRNHDRFPSQFDPNRYGSAAI
jgi:hypothetical protein